MSTAVKKAVGIPMNGLDLLRADHMKAEMVAVEIRIARDPKKRKVLLGALTEALGKHMRLEEEILYPVCARSRKLSRLIDHARTDHQLFKNALKDLAVLDPSTGQFNALLMKAVVEVEKHVYEEENLLFPSMRRVLGRAEFQRVNREITAAHRREELKELRAA
jgi:iron-sulfur cluster repair protein YtfE (RIC family)